MPLGPVAWKPMSQGPSMGKCKVGDKEQSHNSASDTPPTRRLGKFE